MTIEALKNAKLSPMTAGYLTIYLKLSDIYAEASQVSGMGYLPGQIDTINRDFNEALEKAQEEIMNLTITSMTEYLCSLDNTTLL